MQLEFMAWTAGSEAGGVGRRAAPGLQKSWLCYRLSVSPLQIICSHTSPQYSEWHHIWEECPCSCHYLRSSGRQGPNPT
jgi:hypothetical protein